MKTIFFPAHSLKNKEFTENLAPDMGATDFEIINWEHWKDNNPRPLDVPTETQKALQAIGDQHVNLWAKSIGSYIAVQVYKAIPDQIEKIILCGFPYNDITEEQRAEYSALSSFPDNKIVVFQNENDNHGSFDQTKEVFNKINPSIQVISKHRSDHDYPYPEDFKNFLSEKL